MVFGGAVRVCQNKYTARRTVLELPKPEGWPNGEILKSMLKGDVQLYKVPGLFNRELKIARFVMRKGVKTIAVPTLAQTICVILWLGGSP